MSVLAGEGVLYAVCPEIVPARTSAIVAAVLRLSEFHD